MVTAEDDGAAASRPNWAPHLFYRRSVTAAKLHEYDGRNPHHYTRHHHFYRRHCRNRRRRRRYLSTINIIATLTIITMTSHPPIPHPFPRYYEKAQEERERAEWGDTEEMASQVEGHLEDPDLSELGQDQDHNQDQDHSEGMHIDADGESHRSTSASGNASASSSSSSGTGSGGRGGTGSGGTGSSGSGGSGGLGADPHDEQAPLTLRSGG